MSSRWACHPDIDGAPLDASAIVRQAARDDPGIQMSVPSPAEPHVRWQGQVESDGTGPRSSYFVRVFNDGTGTCQCPAFYFRATLRKDARYSCKHIIRARTRLDA